MDAAAEKEARAIARKAALQAKKDAKKGGTPKAEVVDGHAAKDPAHGAAARTATGQLTSEKRAKDIKISSFSLSLHGIVLIEDTEIELNWGNRYGLIGRNGCGKRCVHEPQVCTPRPAAASWGVVCSFTALGGARPPRAGPAPRLFVSSPRATHFRPPPRSTLLETLANREVPIPDHMDVYLLAEEAQPGEMTALEYVIDSAQKEMVRLEALGETLLTEEGPDSEALQVVYDRQTELDPATFVSRASSILVGLGFSAKPEAQGSHINKQTKDMSGGWRMRVALARALFISPSVLLLDEPTNHLDLEACVWLENYLSTYSKVLVVVSHSQDFLNGVCTNMMVMQRRKLKFWKGNYDSYLSTRADQDKNQQTQYNKQQEEIAHTKQFIASCGTYANLVRQAQSRQKLLDQMIEKGLIEAPWSDPVFKFKFPETSTMPPPLISFSDAAFSYSGKKSDYLFSMLRFGIDADSRIALVGPNGAGKSTLLKLMVGENRPCEGNVAVRSGVTIGRFHQHSAEVLDNEATPVDYITRKFHDKFPGRKFEDWRSVVGTYGIPSEYHILPIKCLSDGLKTRLVFCEISLTNPHILLLDEPTNAADMEMIDSMAEAINAFQGGVVVISHDFRLLRQVAKEIWIVSARPAAILRCPASPPTPLARRSTTASKSGRATSPPIRRT
jgi:ATP-binding cassette subfamily F protein 2